MARIVFRCDASAEMGAGHLARCMALARALRARGASIELMSCSLPEQLRARFVAATRATVHMLAPPPGDDARQCGEILGSGPRAEWLVVDHYALDAGWEAAVRPRVASILAIDDLADRPHACDALLDQNFFRDAQARYAGRVPRHADRMLGPRYALIGEEFSAARARIAERDGQLRRIFVCFGSHDGAGQTLRALQAIDAAQPAAPAVDVAIGANDPQRGEIEAHCGSRPGLALHLDAANICDLMAKADLAIGASGIMNWERAALSLPSIVASVAENQHAVAQALAGEQACIYLGRAAEWTAATLAGLLRGLHGAPTLLGALGKRAGALTDGGGAQRVASRLLPDPIALRRAVAADCDAMHAWRNAEETRRASFDPGAIELAEHRRWFQRTVDDPRAVLLIGEHGGEPVGVLRYDIQGERAGVSVYLAPGQHGKGRGTALLRAGSRWLRDRHPAVSQLRADIRRGNRRSIGAFLDAGYNLDGHRYALEIAHAQR